MHGLMSDADVIQRVFDHIDNNTTDLADRVWHEPVTSYLSDKNFADELELFRRLPTVFLPVGRPARNGVLCGSLRRWCAHRRSAWR